MSRRARYGRPFESLTTALRARRLRPLLGSDRCPCEAGHPAQLPGAAQARRPAVDLLNAGVRRLTTFRRAAGGFCPGQTVDRARRVGPQTRQTTPPPPQPRDRALARRRPGPRAYDSANYPAATGISVGHASKGGRTRTVRHVWSTTPQGAEGFSGSRRASGRLGGTRCGRRSGRAARRLSGRQAGMSRWFVPAPHRATGTGRVE